MEKKLKDMTLDERAAAIKSACAKLNDEFANPAISEKLSAVLRGASVNH